MSHMNWQNMATTRFWFGAAFLAGVLASPALFWSQEAWITATMWLVLPAGLLVLAGDTSDFKCMACKKRIPSTANICHRCQTPTRKGQLAGK